MQGDLFSYMIIIYIINNCLFHYTKILNSVFKPRN